MFKNIDPFKLFALGVLIFSGTITCILGYVFYHFIYKFW